MRAHCYLAAIVVLAPCAAGAQTTAADGVQALIRGDYTTAARTLRPLAEGAGQPDPLAQFFMAALYHSGRGVAADPIRACGLYLKAATPTNPLATRSLALAQTIHLDHQFVRDLCSAPSADSGRVPPAATSTATQSPAPPQTSTAGGVDALVRGNDQRAAEILKPIAESWPPRDHVAEFFMATLYESGRGVQADRMRACALYFRASLDTMGPFSRQAEALSQSLQRSWELNDFQDCMLLASIGFDHGFQPATFTLEPGHWISLDLRGAAITYEGNEKRTGLSLAIGGIRFLPIEHTELTVGRARSTRRHFIEFFAWIPGQNAQTWTLIWHVFEVIRNDLIAITREELMTISGERPPTGPIDVHGMARLTVNDVGDPEWAVLSGPHQRSEVIESEAEKRERNEQARARQSAEARVDWTRVRDPQRAPTLTYADADGCGNVFVYGRSADRTEAITIRAGKDFLGLSTTPRTFDVLSQPSALEVLVHVYERPVRSWPFCTDVILSMGPEETWRTARGAVTVELSPPEVTSRAPFGYRATIRIVGAEFVSATGARVKQVQPITLTAIVGWLPG